jgi:hypothetical protein
MDPVNYAQAGLPKIEYLSKRPDINANLEKADSYDGFGTFVNLCVAERIFTNYFKR